MCAFNHPSPCRNSIALLGPRATLLKESIIIINARALRLNSCRKSAIGPDVSWWKKSMMLRPLICSPRICMIQPVDGHSGAGQICRRLPTSCQRGLRAWFPSSWCVVSFSTRTNASRTVRKSPVKHEITTTIDRTLASMLPRSKWILSSSPSPAPVRLSPECVTPGRYCY